MNDGRLLFMQVRERVGDICKDLQYMVWLAHTLGARLEQRGEGLPTDVLSDQPHPRAVEVELGVELLGEGGVVEGGVVEGRVVEDLPVRGRFGLVARQHVSADQEAVLDPRGAIADGARVITKRAIQPVAPHEDRNALTCGTALGTRIDLPKTLGADHRCLSGSSEFRSTASAHSSTPGPLVAWLVGRSRRRVRARPLAGDPSA